MELSYEDHYQTSVPLLQCDEELIETLEDHQVNIEVTEPLLNQLSVRHSDSDALSRDESAEGGCPL